MPAEFPRRILIGNSLNKPTCLLPGYAPILIKGVLLNLALGDTKPAVYL